MHRKQKPRQKPRLPVGVVAMNSQSAVFENICKTVFVFFPKLVGSGLWKLNMWKIVIIFNYSFCFVCLNSLNPSSPSMHPPCTEHQEHLFHSIFESKRSFDFGPLKTY